MDLYPLTKPQQSIWYMDQYFGKSVACVTGSVLFEKPVDVEALQAALNKTIEQLDSLRIRVILDDGTPMQYIAEHDARAFEIVRFLKKDDFSAWVESLARTPFDPNGKLHKFYIVIVEKKTGFVTHLHHVTTDAWALNLLANNVVRNLKGEPVPVRRYLDYRAEEQEYEASTRHEKDRAFFLSLFEQCSEPAYLSDRQAKNVESCRLNFTIGASETDRIKVFCCNSKLTPYSLFMTALAIYIYRIKDAQGVYIGTTVLNRAGRQAKETAGAYINTVPVLFRINEDESALENLRRNAEGISGVFRHQRYPYSDLLRDIRGKYSFTDRLYDVMLNYQNAALNENGVATQWHFCGCQGESLNIHINDRQRQGMFHLDYDYQSELFAQRDIERLHGHLMNMIFDVIENPEKKPYELSLMADSELRQVVYGFNDTVKEYPAEKTLDEVFEEQAVKTPNNTAATFRGNHITYKELDRKSDQLARMLMERGIGPDDIVGLMLYRSLEMIISIFAILKAGGAYMPIDPAYPEDRIKYMLEDSKSKVVLTTKEISEKLDYTDHIDVEDDSCYASEYFKQGDKQHTSRNLAYVIYTSGSTGKPKGVMIEHYSVINRINWMQSRYPISADDVILQKTPYTFDVSVWELFWWSFAGAKVCFLEPGDQKFPDRIIEEVKRNKATVMHFVPSMLNSFLEYLETHGGIDKLATLKQVFASGEELTVNQVKRFNKCVSGKHNIKLSNLYGPTEATVDVSYHDCESGSGFEIIPIGKPIDNIQLYIFDKHNNTLPIGATGELHIAGDGLARGYVNNPGLTSEKFIDNPFEKGRKIYKTGDLARWLDNGEIEYLGRLDRQVKIRGNRVELGEIELALQRHPDIKEAVVAAQSTEAGNTRLCAYYVENSKTPISSLKVFLNKYLPEYMIPSLFIRIDKMPLTSNGKIDKKALPIPDATISADTEYVEPRGGLEKEIAGAWSKVLGIDRIGRNDNFFEIGGDSLNTISVIIELNRKISFADIYENPTVELLAARIQSGRDEFRYLLNMTPGIIGEKNIICFPYAGGNAITYKNVAEAIKELSDRHCVYSINLPGHDVGKEDDFICIRDIARSVAEEIKSLDGSIIIYGHCVGSALAVEVTKLLDKQGIKVERVLLGGIFPPAISGIFGKPIDPWKFVTDEGILSALTKMGLPEMNENGFVEFFVSAFRNDVKEYFGYFFTEKGWQLRIPLTSIVGESDPMTKGYIKKHLRWNKTFKNVKLRTIKNANHYFISTHANETANLILDG